MIIVEPGGPHTPLSGWILYTFVQLLSRISRRNDYRPNGYLLLSWPLFCDSHLRFLMKPLANILYLHCFQEALIVSSWTTHISEDESCLHQDGRCELPNQLFFPREPHTCSNLPHIDIAITVTHVYANLAFSRGVTYIFQVGSYWHRHNRCSRL